MKVIRYSLLCLILALCLASLNAQSDDWLWASAAGGLSPDRGQAIATDGSGNSWVAGIFTTSASFGSFTLTGVGYADLFVGKLDSAGNWLWVRNASVGGPLEAILARNLTLAADGSIYVAGFFSGTAVFGGTTLVSSGYNDVFVAKLDPAGNWLWARKAGGSSYDDCQDMALDSSGNLYLVGSFLGSMQFGSIFLTSMGSTDAFFAKLDPAGNWLWAIRAGSINTDSGDNAFDITIDSADNIYVTGAFNGSISFGAFSLTSLGVDNSHDIFICKLNTAGNWLWARQAGDYYEDWSYYLELDAAGNLYVAGMFNTFTSFGTEVTLQSIGGIFSEIFLAKLDPAGNWLWARQAGGYDSITLYGMALDSSANIYLTGTFTGHSRFGPEIILDSSSSDIFLAKLTTNGDWLMARQAGGPGMDYGSSIAVDANNRLYLTGFFEEAAQFASGLSLESAGAADVWVAKMQISTAVDDDTITAPAFASLAQNYPNPFNPSTTISLQITDPSTSYKLCIYDLKGRRIRTLIDGYLSAGEHQLLWNGKDDRGQNLSSGVYLYRLSNGTEALTRKMILSK